MHTADCLGAGTDANVFIELVGERSRSAEYRLDASRINRNAFERGGKDRFDVVSVDHGRLQKVVIRHDGSGIGDGWCIDQVYVKHIEGNQIYAFGSGRVWLDSMRGDKATKRELFWMEGEIVEFDIKVSCADECWIDDECDRLS